MKLTKAHELLLVISLVLLQFFVKPVTSNLPYENKNVVKFKQDPTRFQLASSFRIKKNVFTPRHNNATTSRENNKINGYRTTAFGTGKNYSQDKNKTTRNNKTIPPMNQFKKWQVGRVSRKQYEIINMLWRKTKIFEDLDSTTAKHHSRRTNDTKRNIDSHSGFHQPFRRLPSWPTLSSTTPSYIEFYYLDETDERVKEFTTKRHTQNPKQIKEHKLRSLGNHKFILSDSPMFSFRIYNPSYRQSVVTTKYLQATNRMRKRKTRTHDSSLTGFNSLISLTPSYKFARKRAQQNTFKTSTTSSSIPSANFTLNVTNTISTLNVSSTSSSLDVSSTISPLKVTGSISNVNITSIFCPVNVTSSISIPNITNTISTTNYNYENQTCPNTDTSTFVTTTKSEKIITNITTYRILKRQKSTTAYDKIKFFEIYDRHTPVPYYDENGTIIDMDNVEIFIKENEANNNVARVLLEHIDQSIGNEHSKSHKTKHSKKHIIEAYNIESKYQNNDDNSVEANITINIPTPNVFNVSNATEEPKVIPINDYSLLLTESNETTFVDYKKSKQVEWFKYPFAAAYVYEPSQVHCDAASISPHWLITSGSCLSRHHKNPGGEGRSAFVTYCGDSWWNPERVTYVKYSLVHPRFHPKDKTRRHLYNIGLIQVVSSMASACNAWSSISLMSHQFVADGEGATANAIGWGLNRFDSRYSSNDLPKSLLMSYENQVYLNSCPGNVGYSKAKRLDEEGGIKNVYCLSLPPYLGEDTDPIHGGLLLVGGKLVALYLQEERRPWGEQCAQYTGTWRLVPWVLDVARENDEVETFSFEI